MTINTIKFSQFNVADYNDATNKLVGYGSGANIQRPDVITWTTTTRPASPYDGLLGFNTDLQQYEYWNSLTSQWVQLTSTSSTFTWNNVTTLSATMMPNNGYVANNAGQVVLTLPLLANFGEIIRVSGYGSGGWKIIFNSMQNLIFGNRVATTTTGSLASTNQYDQVELLCVSANTSFIVLDSVGNLTLI